MRRASLLIKTASWRRSFGYPALFDVVSHARVLQNLTLTHDLFVDLWEVDFKPGCGPADLVGAFGIEEATGVSTGKRRALVVVRAPFHGFLKRLYFDYGVSFEPPLEFAPDHIRVTIVGADGAMRQGLTYLRRSRILFDTLSAGPFGGPGSDPLAALTDRQRATLELAHRRGYFEVPSRTTARALAREAGVSHQALLDTLHRAERRLLAAALPAEPSKAVAK